MLKQKINSMSDNELKTYITKLILIDKYINDKNKSNNIDTKK